MKVGLKKDDTVLVVSGRERGKTGKIIRVLHEKRGVLVERLNMIKRHQKATSPQNPGGILEKEAPLHLSNVMLLCPSCNKPTRVGRTELDEKHVRKCRRCGQNIDKA